MPRRPLPLLLLLVAAAVSQACSCRWFESQEALQDLFGEADVVLMGYAVCDMTPDPRHPETAEYIGRNVLFKVTRVYKGQLRADTVFVLQAAVGDCAMTFVRQDTVLVFGGLVRAVRRAPRSNPRRYDPGMHNDAHIYYTAHQSPHYRLFRCLHARYSTLTTSQCVTFDPHDELVAAFIRPKAYSRP